VTKFLVPEYFSLRSLIVSMTALGVSLITAWFNLFHRGKLLATRPSLIALTYESRGKPQPLAKIFLRTLLCSTGKRGRVIESLFLRVKDRARNEEFSFWGYGDKDLVRGSGLFVGENGIVTNHHFNPISDMSYQFITGKYELELVAKIINRSHHLSLLKITLDVPEGAFDPRLTSPNTRLVAMRKNAVKGCYA